MDQLLINALLNSENLYIVADTVSQYTDYISSFDTKEDYKKVDKESVSIIKLYKEYTEKRIESRDFFRDAVYENLCKINNLLLDSLNSEYRLNGLVPPIEINVNMEERVEIFNIYVNEIILEEESKLEIKDTDKINDQMIFGILISVLVIIYNYLNDEDV